MLIYVTIPSLTYVLETDLGKIQCTSVFIRRNWSLGGKLLLVQLLDFWEQRLEVSEVLVVVAFTFLCLPSSWGLMLNQQQPCQNVHTQNWTFSKIPDGYLLSLDPSANLTPKQCSNSEREKEIKNKLDLIYLLAAWVESSLKFNLHLWWILSLRFWAQPNLNLPSSILLGCHSLLYETILVDRGTDRIFPLLTLV